MVSTFRIRRAHAAALSIATFGIGGLGLAHAQAQVANKYFYDALGRVISVSHWTNGVRDGEVIYSYDAAGNRTQLLSGNPNRSPVAVDDNVFAGANYPFVFDPRVNDSDPDGDPLTITGVTQPANGSATVAADGTSITYTSKPGVASDTFNYTVADTRGATATAKVNVTTGVQVEYLVVGGGGTTGGGSTGGAGGGEVKVGSMPVWGAFAIAIGAGANLSTVPNAGASSLGSLVIARGGKNRVSTTAGASGAGYPGGVGVGYMNGGGGGGAGGPGLNGASDGGAGGAGGPGVHSAISGVDQGYGGGGGGGGDAAPGGAGVDGGGSGGGSNTYAGTGTDATYYGGGGGSEAHNVSSTTGAGYQGLVIIRYVGSQRATGGTITSITVNGVNYTVHSFTSNGTFTTTSR